RRCGTHRARFRVESCRLRSTHQEDSMRCIARRAALALVLMSLALTASASASVRVLLDAREPSRTLFPSDRFTSLDLSQNTFLRVRLPRPDCTAQPVACEDIDVLNTLDG